MLLKPHALAGKEECWRGVTGARCRVVAGVVAVARAQGKVAGEQMVCGAELGKIAQGFDADLRRRGLTVV